MFCFVETETKKQNEAPEAEGTTTVSGQILQTAAVRADTVCCPVLQWAPADQLRSTTRLHPAGTVRGPQVQTFTAHSSGSHTSPAIHSFLSPPL